MRISYSFGIIDLLHYGHINVLTEAKETSDLHIFGLVSDEAALGWMGTMVSSYDERKKVLESISHIDEIMLQKTLDPLENLKLIHKRFPDAEITLFHGDNWRIIPAERFLKSIGGQISFIKYYEKLSPENIQKQLNTRHIEKRKRSNLISTKANTLLALRDKLKHSKIEDIVVITTDEYYSDKANVLKTIMDAFNGETIIVRSSSSNEDNYELSNAGHYESVLHVDSADESEICAAIETVISSYERDALDDGEEQILIQTQTQHVAASGVIFTRDLQKNRPYYVINYDDGGSTDSVTSGTGGKTIWFSHQGDIDRIPLKWRKLLTSVSEIERLLDGMILDIEFAITQTNEVVIFQVRPLAANYKFEQKINDDELFQLIVNEKLKYEKLINAYDHSKMMLSDMAFWNPSEIIGSNPRNLDYSLYREIITKQAWNEGLVPMGYKAVNKDLMYKIGNKPYISIEYSFMSLIPSKLDDPLSVKLMNYYKEKLKQDLTAHDKIEFEIVYSCFDFETQHKLDELEHFGFDVGEIHAISEALHELTCDALHQYHETLRKDLEDIELLETSRKSIQSEIARDGASIDELIDYFKQLIRHLKKYGTPQFSRQARYAFIASSMCKSLVAKGYFDQESMDQFMLSIHTVASEFEYDFNRYMNGDIDRAYFNDKYGHLRSGTYDIRTERYEKLNFMTSKRETSITRNDPTDKQGISLDAGVVRRALDDINFLIDEHEYIEIIKSSLEQRELFKFEFTKSLSLALEILIIIAERLQMDRHLFSYLEISDIYASEYYRNENELVEFWTTIMQQRKLMYYKRSELVLPEVIQNERDLDFIEIGESRPNFITDKVIDGEVVLIEENNEADIRGKIVVITKADPGFDWIFAEDIKGLITMYGGAASHMAIRCAEFGIPAAIGCGERIYNYVSSLSRLKLDCINGKITEWG